MNQSALAPLCSCCFARSAALRNDSWHALLLLLGLCARRSRDTPRCSVLPRRARFSRLSARPVDRQRRCASRSDSERHPARPLAHLLRARRCAPVPFFPGPLTPPTDTGRGMQRSWGSRTRSHPSGSCACAGRARSRAGSRAASLTRRRTRQSCVSPDSGCPVRGRPADEVGGSVQCPGIGSDNWGYEQSE